jgi:hypothetical protein
MLNDPTRGRSAACPPLDTPRAPLHSAAVAVLELSASGDGFSFEQLLHTVAGRLAEYPALQHSLEIHGPGTHRLFEPTDHVRFVTPTEAVTERALCVRVGELAGQPMEPGRPRWRLSMIEGLYGGLVALVLVMDAALADPRACTETLRRLLGLTPEVEPTPSLVSICDGTRPTLAARGEDIALPHEPTTQRWSGPLSDSRIAAYARSHRAAIDVVRRAFGGTRENVALAACTRALRRYLQAHGDPVDEPLVAALPTSDRTLDREGTLVRFLRLPVQLADPVDQLRVIQSELYRAQVAPRITGKYWLGQACEIASTEHIASRRQVRSHSGPDRLRHDLVFRNLAGPERTLSLGTARVVALHPHGPLVDGVGLDLSVIRYGESIDFGLMTCSDLAPDAVEIATGIEAAVADLVKRSFEERDGSLELADWGAESA